MAQKNFCGPKVKVKVNSPGRQLRFLHLLLQFSTDFDKTGCILFTIGWSNFLLLRFLNFYLRPKCHRLKVCIPKICIFKNFFENHMAAILFWDKNSKIWATKSCSIRLWKKCNQNYQNRLKIVGEDVKTVKVYHGKK